MIQYNANMKYRANERVTKNRFEWNVSKENIENAIKQETEFWEQHPSRKLLDGSSIEFSEILAREVPKTGLEGIIEIDDEIATINGQYINNFILNNYMGTKVKITIEPIE